MRALWGLLWGGSLFVAANSHVEQGNRLFAEGKLAQALDDEIGRASCRERV